MLIEFNPNPDNAKRVGDCSVRAIAKALDVDWDTAYLMNSKNGFALKDMPSSNAVWGATLRQNGFTRKAIPNECPDCYTANDFCEEHPEGTFVLAFTGHVATVVDGDIYDAWDSTKEIPQFYYEKESEEE